MNVFWRIHKKGVPLMDAPKFDAIAHDPSIGYDGAGNYALFLYEVNQLRGEFSFADLEHPYISLVEEPTQ